MSCIGLELFNQKSTSFRLTHGDIRTPWLVVLLNYSGLWSPLFHCTQATAYCMLICTITSESKTQCIQYRWSAGMGRWKMRGIFNNRNCAATNFGFPCIFQCKEIKLENFLRIARWVVEMLWFIHFFFSSVLNCEIHYFQGP